MKDPKSYDALSFLVGWLGIYEGLLPFAAKIFGWHPALALPLRLPNPAWWIVAAVIVVVAFVLLAVLDNAKKRRHA